MSTEHKKKNKKGWKSTKTLITWNVDKLNIDKLNQTTYSVWFFCCKIVRPVLNQSFYCYSYDCPIISAATEQG